MNGRMDERTNDPRSGKDKVCLLFVYNFMQQNVWIRLFNQLKHFKIISRAHAQLKTELSKNELIEQKMDSKDNSKTAI